MPMRLNFDVLLVILSLIEDRPVMAKLMRTCRTLQRAGVPYLLEGGINIRNSKGLASLCHFMLNKNPPRFLHLRHLILDPWVLMTPTEGPFANVDVVVSFFKNAGQLETLELSMCDDIFVDSRISQAISSLSNIRQFKTFFMTVPVYQMLCKFHSPLTKLDAGYGDTDMDPCDPVHLFQHFKNSLQELHVHWVVFESSDILYPRLTTLSAKHCAEVDVGCMFRAFPNLRDFTLRMADEDDSMEDLDVEDSRQENVVAQAAGTWEALERLRGTLLGLYLLAIRSKVKRLCVRPGSLRTEHGTKLRTILSDSRPTALLLSIESPSFDSSQLGEYLAPALETLNALELEICLRGEYWEDPTPTIVRQASHPPFRYLALTALREQIATLATLSSFSIQLLVLKLDWSYTKCSPVTSAYFLPEEERPPKPVDPRRPSDPLRTLDLESLAQDVMCAIPSLRHFFVATGYRSTMEYWEIQTSAQEHSDGSERSLVQLSQASGREYLRKSLLS